MLALDVARSHADRLLGVGGVAGVMLGGSQARGTADSGSDIDLGVYYRMPLDVAGLRDLASEVAGHPVEVAGPGGWGPWVDGGAWLDLAAGRVDWILRDLDRVRAQWRLARRGEFSLHHQPGHPFGFLSTAYVGEVALGVVASDPGGELTELRSAAARYPAELGRAFVAWLWEAEFSLAVARKAAHRGDATYVSMCVGHAVGIMAHAIHGKAGCWTVNEKGLVGEAGRLPGAPMGFAERAHAVAAGDGAEPADLTARLDTCEALLAEVRADTRAPADGSGPAADPER